MPAPFKKLILNLFPKNGCKGISFALKFSFKNVAKLTTHPDFSHPLSLTDFQRLFISLKVRESPLE